MDTLQIDKKITAPGFLGAFPYDEIPEKPKSDAFSLVINTESSKEPGDHWLVLLYTKNHISISLIVMVGLYMTEPFLASSRKQLRITLEMYVINQTINGCNG